MKFKSIFFIFIFSGFLIVPAVISFINAEADISVCFTINEEENSKDAKTGIENIEIVENGQDVIFATFIHEDAKKHSFAYTDSFSASEIEILLPPPEYIV